MPAEDDERNFISEIEERMKEEERKEHPDYLNTVYCDRHLGVKMVLATAWGSVEWSDTAVDINPTLLWHCPKAGCDRHYEPTMFGYHVNEAGRRLDGRNQQRGNHLGLPFMYIGKVGEGRRFMCPLYKCDEQKPEVALFVVDEEVQIPKEPLADLRGTERKRAIEMLVFHSFASTSGLTIDEGSVENKEPDYPDILCTISGQKYWFELGRIIHKDVAEKLNPNRRKREGGFSYDQEKPLMTVVKNKATKKYITEGSPVDLVLHFDRRLGSTANVERLVEKHARLLASLTTVGPFKRVWVFDEHARTVVWPKI